ncbi:MAG: hypothetical protein ACFFEF_12055 [Candidatus Thorarchaeota archaeon]
MSEEADRSKRMCSYCRVRPASRWYRGINYSYCSLECSSIERYGSFGLVAFCFGIIFLLGLVALIMGLLGAYVIDFWAIAQISFFGFFFFYYLASAIAGFRGARRKRCEEEPDPLDYSTRYSVEERNRVEYLLDEE